MSPVAPAAKSALRLLAFTAFGALLLGLAVGFGGGSWAKNTAKPLIPPMETAVTVTTPSPNVLVAVRDLARLESAAFHMERVIDLTEEQSRLWGFVKTEDSILLVGVAEVTAGVDLSSLTAADIVTTSEPRKVRITLPPPLILHAALDNAKTYVHSRKTGTLADRRENLETRARQEAERTLVEAAKEAGILSRASENARRTVEALVHSLGYPRVEVTFRPLPP